MSCWFHFYVNLVTWGWVLCDMPITSNNLGLLTKALMALGLWRVLLIASRFSRIQIHIAIVYCKKWLESSCCQPHIRLMNIRIHWEIGLHGNVGAGCQNKSLHGCMAKHGGHSGLLFDNSPNSQGKAGGLEYIGIFQISQIFNNTEEHKARGNFKS